MSSLIHPSAIIEEGAKLGDNVTIGPYCIIGSEVELGNNNILKSHVNLQGKTKFGDNNTIYPFASIGTPPQDLKYKGEASSVIIGNNNIIREYVTIHPGTLGGGMITSVGSDCLLMIGVHIAHDCRIGNNVIFANYVNLAGHVIVGDYVRIGGLAAVAQYTRIGSYAMVGGLSALSQDLIPFGLASNKRANLEGVNLVGMKRSGFDQKESLEAAKAVKEIFDSDDIFTKNISHVLEKYQNNSIVKEIVHFLQEDETRSFCQFRQKP